MTSANTCEIFFARPALEQTSQLTVRSELSRASRCLVVHFFAHQEAPECDISSHDMLLFDDVTRDTTSVVDCTYIVVDSAMIHVD